MEIVKTFKGSDKIIFDGYIYIRGQSTLTEAKWRCNNRGCKSVLRTPLDYVNYAGKRNSNLVRVNRPHIHDRDLQACQKARHLHKAALCRMATEAERAKRLAAKQRNVYDSDVDDDNGNQNQEETYQLTIPANISDHTLDESCLFDPTLSMETTTIQISSDISEPTLGTTTTKKNLKKTSSSNIHQSVAVTNKSSASVSGRIKAEQQAPPSAKPTLSLVRIGFIGAGYMAKTLAKGFIRSGMVKPNQICAAAPSMTNLNEWKEMGCHIAAINNRVFEPFWKDGENFSYFLFLCVHPSVLLRLKLFTMLPRLKINLSKLIVVSTVIGVRCEMLRKLLRKTGQTGTVNRNNICTARIVANASCAYNNGVVGFYFNRSIPLTCPTDQFEKLMSTLGICREVEEEQLEPVGALTGSGIGMVHTMLQAMSDGAVLSGLPRRLAAELTEQTVVGATVMARETQVNPIALRDRVSSTKAGINGVFALERSAFKSSIMEAICQATQQWRMAAMELSEEQRRIANKGRKRKMMTVVADEDDDEEEDGCGGEDASEEDVK